MNWSNDKSERPINGSLRMTEDRYQHFIESQTDIITEFTADGLMTFVNNAYCRYVGQDRSTLIGTSIFDVVPEDQVQPLKEFLSGLSPEQPHLTGENQVESKDGELRFFEWSNTASFDDQGAITIVLSVGRDITDRKAMENAVAMSERRFRDYILATADHYWETDEQHRFTYISDVSSNTDRLNPETAMGKTRWELDKVTPDAEHWREYKAILDQHEPFRDFEYTRMMKDGTELHIRASGVPVFVEGGRFVGYRGVNREVSREVTERRLAQERLEAAQQRLLEATEQLEAGFVLWDAEGRFIHCNTYFRNIQGEYGSYLTPGVKFEDFMTYVTENRMLKLDNEQFKDGWRAHAKAQQADSGSFEYTIEDGRWFRARRQILADGSTIALHTDISDSKQMEKLKDEFVSVTSHELRTPLTSITGAIGLVMEGVTGAIPQESKDVLEIAHRNCERLTALVNDILDISKIESDQVVLNLETIEILPFVQNAIVMNANYAEQFGTSFVLEDASGEVSVSADVDRLNQILSNLLSNAAKYSPKNEAINLAVTSRDGVVRVSVKDKGPGIPQSFQDEVFEKFSQADSTDSRSNGGTGLGLSITKKLVEAHGGRIDFETEIGRGTTFYFELPELMPPAN